MGLSFNSEPPQHDDAAFFHQSCPCEFQVMLESSLGILGKACLLSL